MISGHNLSGHHPHDISGGSEGDLIPHGAGNDSGFPPHFPASFHPDFFRGASEFVAGSGDFAPSTTAGVLSAAANGFAVALVGKKKKKKSPGVPKLGATGMGGAGGCLAILSEKDQARKERHRMYMRKWREKRKSEGMPLY